MRRPRRLPGTASSGVATGEGRGAGPADVDPHSMVPCRAYVEDNPSNVRLVERVLARGSGVSLLVATRGSVGLELARRHRPDLVLLDLNLPDLPGAVVLERLRAEPLTRDIRVVVGADATPQQQEWLKAAGVADYLTKPSTSSASWPSSTVSPEPGLAEPPVGTPPPADRGAVLDPAVLDRFRVLE